MERGLSIHRGYFGSSKAAVTDDKSPLFQSPAGKTGRLTGNPDRVDAYQPTFPKFRWLRGQVTRWASWATANRAVCAAGVRTSRLTAPRRVMIRFPGVYSSRLTTRKRK
jgi:hypothetical protein